MTDNYFGTKILDNYRWLEDARSAETREFIDARECLYGRYLKQARIRPQVVDDLNDSGECFRRRDSHCSAADSFFFRKRLAGEQQFSIYVRQVDREGQAPGGSGRAEHRSEPIGGH